MTEQEAKEAINKVAEWLATFEEKETGDFFGTIEGEKAYLAREFATQLLRASKADDMCGCPLCQQ